MSNDLLILFFSLSSALMADEHSNEAFFKVGLLPMRRARDCREHLWVKGTVVGAGTNAKGSFLLLSSKNRCVTGEFHGI
ncbi:MAG: hypothetical protein ACLTZT_20355 [Butyricimonas faecalis]